MTADEHLARMIEALALAGAEWELLHAPRDGDQSTDVSTGDSGRLIARAEQLVADAQMRRTLDANGR